MGRTREIGNMGEDLTAAYLQERGYTILERQYRCRMGEVDIIARQGEILCFVEVKTRSSLMAGLPREFVTGRKQQRILLAARRYLMEKRLDCPVRFDVAEVYIKDDAPPEIVYLEQAFFA